MSRPDVLAVRSYLIDFQDRVCAALERIDGAASFRGDEIAGPGDTLARPRSLAEGAHLEKAGVNFTHSAGATLPAAATARRPELAGRRFQAVSTSLIVHPRNPHAPTSHANLRFFVAEHDDADPVWWFGGGLDLTPHYGYEEDAVHWHRTAAEACAPFGSDLYPAFKKQCDEYFALAHRGETRGIGGLFFDDYAADDFETSFGLARSIGDHFLPAYEPILERRIHTPFTEHERAFQLYRRGRYVEFNLLYDRGTRYGLQSGRRIESVLVSMPPLAAWPTSFPAEPGSREARFASEFLKPRNWLRESGG